ncbi:MAG: hypothetical protein ACRD3F_14965 [Acidobacteriaceae bacterium]
MLKRTLISLVIPLLFLLLAQSTHAQNQNQGWDLNIGPSGTEVYGAMAGAAAGIGAITIFAIHEHHTHTLKGCVESSAGGLRVTNEGDKRSYVLNGETGGLKAGERVRLSGHKAKGNATQRQFVVKKVSKDYGACRVSPATL